MGCLDLLFVRAQPQKCAEEWVDEAFAGMRENKGNEIESLQNRLTPNQEVVCVTRIGFGF